MSNLPVPYKFKIILVEDDEFYNTILTRQLKKHTAELALMNGYNFEINSYIHSEDCVRNLSTDTDIAILDYYLDDNSTATKIIDIIQEKCDRCKIVIISQFKNFKTYYQTLNHSGAYHFIFKDKYALANCCSVVSDIIKENGSGT